MAERILFLDIDGVLNGFEPFKFDSQVSLWPRCVKHLNHILAEAGAKMVLSSSWRYYVHDGAMTVGGFDLLLRTHGVVGHRLIGVTRPDGDSEDDQRWKQIADWLKAPAVEVAKYCILDDMLEAFGGRPGVRTDSYTGLTREDAEEAIALLLC